MIDAKPANNLIGISKDETLQACENVLQLLSNLVRIAKAESSEDDQALTSMIQTVLEAVQYARCCQE